jgi:hypothetical protein
MSFPVTRSLVATSKESTEYLELEKHEVEKH